MASPWLLLPPSEKDTDCGFFNIEENKVHRPKDMPVELGKIRCLGSSHGWLLLLSEDACMHLFNPFTRARHQLPFLGSFPGIVGILGTKPCEEIVVKYRVGSSDITDYTVFENMKDFQERFIIKAILSSDPSCNTDDEYKVIVIYSRRSQLAVYNHGGQAWTSVDGRHQPYEDILCCNNQLCALGEDGAVEVWDLNTSLELPVKSMEFKPSFPRRMVQFGLHFLRENCYRRFYLVESSGDLLLVVRYVGDFVTPDGKLAEEGDHLSDEDNHPLCFPYRTMLFDVYKLHSDQKEWVEVESLGDRALFLGGNHSISLSTRDFDGCLGDSIYFTDDYWDRMNEDYLYGGHDMGMFCLEDKSIEPLYEFDSGKLEPAPFWIIPN